MIISDWGPKFRNWVLKTFRPIIAGLGKITTSKGGSLTVHQMDHLRDITKPGDILLSRIKGELTNLFIPGFYGHAAIVCSQGKVVEAIGKGVRETSIGNFLSDKDYIGVFRGNFGDTQSYQKAGVKSRSYVGRPYDYGFVTGDEDFYCSELVWQSYKEVHPHMKFCKREVFGVKTVLPDDFTCVRYWNNIISCIGKGPV